MDDTVQEGRILRAHIVKREARSNIPTRIGLSDFMLVLTCEAAEGPDFSGKVVAAGERANDAA